MSVGVLLLRSNSYADAKCWEDLVYAFTESLKNSSLDEIVLLLHTAIPGSHGWRSKYVRPVSYDRLDEVPRLLLSMAPNTLRAGIVPAVQQQPRVEVATGEQPDEEHDEQGQPKHIDIPQERINDGKKVEVEASAGDHEQEIRVNTAKTTQDAYRRHLEQKRADATRRIQAVYRHYLTRKSAIRKGIDATQAHYWQALRKRSMEIEWSKDSQYYILFRVPLAYVLVCLDAIKAAVEFKKKGAKKRMMTDDDKNLEESMGVLDQYRCDGAVCILYRGSYKSSSKLLKKTIALQKKLSPSSKFHEGRSVTDLQHAVLEVKAVMESLGDTPGSTETRDQIKMRWDRGWKWIAEEQESRAKGKKAEKPKLVLDREDLLYL